MRHDNLYLWLLADPAAPRYVGQLRLVDAGKGVSLQYAGDWLSSGFPLNEDLPLVDVEQLPRWKGMAAGAVDDARPDLWGERVIQYLDKPARLSIMEYLYYGGDERFGALGVSASASNYCPRPKSPLPRLAQAQQLSEVVHKVSAREPVNALERQLLAAGTALARRCAPKLSRARSRIWVTRVWPSCCGAPGWRKTMPTCKTCASFFAAWCSIS